MADLKAGFEKMEATKATLERTVLTAPRWSIATPLGSPVEPEV